MFRLIIICFVAILVSFTAVSPAKAFFANFEKGAIEKLGDSANQSYKLLIETFNNETEEVTRKLSKYMSGFLLSLYIIYFIFKVVQMVIKRDNLLNLLPSFFVVAVVFMLLNNMTIFNRLAQRPLLKTYEMFGGVVVTLNNSTKDGIIKEIASNMSTVFDALNSTSGNLITNFGAVILSLFVMIMLGLVFIVIFLNLIKNYFKIMFPFAFSPLLLVFFVFPALRPITVKAFNIVMDGILKQACMLFAIKVSSVAFYQALNTMKAEITFSGMLLIIVLALVYRELIAVAEGISSELLGTQAMGNPQSMSMLRTAAALGGASSLAAMAFKSIKSGIGDFKNPTSMAGKMAQGMMGFGVNNLKNNVSTLRGGIKGWLQKDLPKN